MKHGNYEYEFLDKIETLKANWHVWAVERYNVRDLDAPVEHGSLQADSNHDMIAWDSWEEN